MTAVHLNPRETLNGLSIIPMANTNSHLMSTLNPVHLPDGAGPYFVTGTKIFNHILDKCFPWMNVFFRVSTETIGTSDFNDSFLK